MNKEEKNQSPVDIIMFGGHSQSRQNYHKPLLTNCGILENLTKGSGGEQFSDDGETYDTDVQPSTPPLRPIFPRI